MYRKKQTVFIKKIKKYSRNRYHNTSEKKKKNEKECGIQYRQMSEEDKKRIYEGIQKGSVKCGAE